MNKLNLATYGVEEMSQQEMVKTDGGSIIAIIAAVVLVAAAVAVLINGGTVTVNGTAVS